MRSGLCIYCSSEADQSKEHCLPLGLGSFRGHHILRNIICKCCNKPISKAEEQFLRAGPEALLRHVRGITGRKHHKKISPFYRGSAGAPPLEIKHPFPDTETDVLWEVPPGTKTLSALRQIGMAGDDGEVKQIPIPRKINTKAGLLRHLRKHGLEKAKPVNFVTDLEDWDKFQSIILQIWPNLKAEMISLPEKKVGMYAAVKITVTPLYFRAVAKIGFHYFLAVFSHRFTGAEAEFEPIRSFIKDGKGRPEDFVLQTDKQILRELGRDFTLTVWGHLLTARVKNRSVSSKVQFFIGPTHLPQVYEIKLGKNPSRIIYPEQHGHFYSYFSKDSKSGYDGKVQSLR